MIYVVKQHSLLHKINTMKLLFSKSTLLLSLLLQFEIEHKMKIEVSFQNVKMI